MPYSRYFPTPLRLLILLLATFIIVAPGYTQAHSTAPMATGAPDNTAGLLTISQAYRAIPHRQSPFNPDRAKMSTDQKQYLTKLFMATDEALRLRVETMRWFQTGGERGLAIQTYYPAMEFLIDELKKQDPPGRLTGISNLIIEALQAEQSYFNAWYETYDTQRRFNPKHKFVKRTHKNLKKAYDYLIQYFPFEPAENQQAFKDHLEALDFLSNKGF